MLGEARALRQLNEEFLAEQMLRGAFFHDPDPRVREQARETRTSTPGVDLTDRERQVLELIAEGLTNRQIGERLDLMEKTVKNYVTGLLRKLGMERRTQAAVYATSLRTQ